MVSFLDVLNFWSSAQEMADDIGTKLSRVQKWRVRRKIPSQAWPSVVDAAKRRGFPVTADILLKASVNKTSRAPPSIVQRKEACMRD